jgi:DNA processing protein
MNDYKRLILHLFLIDGVGPVAIEQARQLLVRYCADDLYRFVVNDFVQNGFALRVSELICDGLKDRAVLEKELALIEKHLVSWTTVGCDDYPALLASIYAPPAVLYWYGGSPFLLDNNCAVVGSRNATSYGKAAVDYLVEMLVPNNITVVSGGAFGIDAAAHNKTLVLGGKTVVVVGAGLLHPYPFAHKDLFRKIADNSGSIVSIFPLNTKPHPGNFPARNRVISGLSAVCVVVQAAQKSGALITAHHALEQGRSIFVVPGSIFESVHKGCHMLATQGAALMIDAADVVNCFGLQNQVTKNQVTTGNKNAHTAIKTALLQDPLQNKIFELCLQRALNVDELVAKTSMPLLLIQSALFQMQLSDHIKEAVGGRWIVQG